MANQLKKEIEIMKDIPTTKQGVDSFLSSRKQVDLPSKQVVEEIVPENSINYIA